MSSAPAHEPSHDRTAPEHPHAALLRDGYTAFAKGDMELIRSLLAERVVHRVPGRGPLCGDYTTPEEVLGFYVKLFELSGGTFRSEPYAVMAGDDYGVALVHTYAERRGRTLTGRAVDVFRFEDGRVTEIRTIAEDQYGDDAFWSG
ncbi:nuclear transport factor 2 family protein [Actinomadura kijaniata]|uniref:nuclear transport factor 2 family protein n=1 Tax=Actinomadura kijaniata TaxID=46161 RepID=UPI00082A237C|nr:nuclear transport factor 2 family protein [Actinomadura kijaniata]